MAPLGKIGIFGGSFDPVHAGHVLAAQEFLRILELDKLLVIPAGRPPHKKLSAFTPTAEERLAMLHLAMDGIAGTEILDIEIHKTEKCFTYHTLCALKEQYPDDELLLLMGTDMFLSFTTWYRYEDLLQMATLCVEHRCGLNKSQQQAFDRQVAYLETECGGKVQVLSNTFLEMSSTTVRRMLFFGCAEDYLPTCVADYIAANGLYCTKPLNNPLPYETLREISLSLHDPKRRPHAAGCSDTARELAKLYGADPVDAERAGILHDITKALSGEDQLRLCKKYGIMTDEYSGEQVKLLHGKTASAIAEHIFGENPAVCSAVAWHTTGKADMTMLEKIIYIADYIEPNRNFDGVEQLRELVYKDIDAAVLEGIQITIDFLLQEGRVLNRYSVEARDFLLQERDKK